MLRCNRPANAHDSYVTRADKFGTIMHGGRFGCKGSHAATLPQNTHGENTPETGHHAIGLLPYLRKISLSASSISDSTVGLPRRPAA